MLYGILFAVVALASGVFVMLGLGGSMVYVPAFTWAGFPVKEVAIPLGLLLNGLTTLLALIPYSRHHLVDWKGGSVMALAAVLLAPVGAVTARFVPVRALLLLFALGVVVAALRMLLVAQAPEPVERLPLRRRWVIGGGAGGFAGFAGGLLGIGGGFIMAPILMWMGYRTKEAAATTAFVVAFSSFSGYLGHVAQGHFDWRLALVVVPAVVVGSQLGAHSMSTRMKPRLVKQVYSVVLLAIALKLVLGVL
jgi:uncharacterized membrane protein YfcA